MKPVMGLVLAMSAGACVSAGPARTTGEMFQEAVTVSGYSFRCHPPDSIRFEERLGRLIPWLEAELGKEHVARVRGVMEMNLGDTDFLSCPTREQRLRARFAVDRLLKELRARSKR